MSAPIMIVDDDVNSILLMTRILVGALIRNPIVTIATGSEAILYLEKQTDLPLLILLDLALSDIHGIDLLRYIRKHEVHLISGLCIFILTVSDDQATMVKTIENGANAFLSKNINLASFLAAAQDCGVTLDIG